METGPAVKFGFLHNGPLDMVGLTKNGAVMRIEVVGKSSVNIGGDIELVVEGVVLGETLESALAELLGLLGKPLMVFDEGTPDDEVVTNLRTRASGQPLEADAARDALWAKLDIEVRQLDVLGPLNNRVKNLLRHDNLIYLGDVVKKTEAELLRTPNFKIAALKALNTALQVHGLYLGMATLGWVPPDDPSLAGTHT